MTIKTLKNIVVDFIKFMWDEQDYLCPHCGYYCTGKSVYCITPKERKNENQNDSND